MSEHYKTFLKAKTKEEAVGAVAKYLRTAWAVAPAKDKTAPGPV